MRLELNFEPESVRLTVRDDGVGFEVPEAPDEFAGQGHFGLLGLAERAELIGANLQVSSQPGNGTAVQVTVPNHSRETAIP